MNIYYAFYCRAYDWYNTTGKKSKDTLRMSALALISTLSFLNLFVVESYLSVLNKHSFINKWGGLVLISLLIIFNFFLISSKKSDALREEYLQWNERKKKLLNIFFYSYLIVTVLMLIIVLIYIAYYKNKFGNYDL